MATSWVLGGVCTARPLAPGLVLKSKHPSGGFGIADDGRYLQRPKQNRKQPVCWRVLMWAFCKDVVAGAELSVSLRWREL